MSDTLAITPIGKPFRATVRPPGSKSLTNRALLLAALAEGRTTLRGVLDADDSRRMVKALTALGFATNAGDEPDSLYIDGLGGRIPKQSARLHLGNAGTAYRFLTAACCLGEAGNAYELDGIERMRQRPVRQLVEPLRYIGANIDYLGEEGYPPLTVRGGGLAGGTIEMAPTLSSQYISSLLQVAPCCRDGLTLRFTGAVTSRPYVQMTLNLMAKFGVEAEVDPAFTQITVRPGHYTATEYAIEPDASAASYFLAAAAVVPGSKCTIDGLGFSSCQGDVWFGEVLQQMGAAAMYERDAVTVIGPREGEKLRGIDVDLNAMPDMAQTLAVVALFAKGRTTIRNVGNLRVKETDRMEALRIELTKLGAAVEIDGDDLLIDPPAEGRITPATIATYDDHRMAMSFAVAGLVAPGIVIADPGCVAKTFPDFFDHLRRLGAS